MTRKLKLTQFALLLVFALWVISLFIVYHRGYTDGGQDERLNWTISYEGGSLALRPSSRHPFGKEHTRMPTFEGMKNGIPYWENLPTGALNNGRQPD